MLFVHGKVLSLQHLIVKVMEALKIEMKPVGLSLETDATHFALALKTWRLRNDMSQREAASRCNVSRYTIMKAEAAKQISWEMMYKIFCKMSEDLK